MVSLTLFGGVRGCGEGEGGCAAAAAAQDLVPGGAGREGGHQAHGTLVLGVLRAGKAAAVARGDGGQGIMAPYGRARGQARRL